MLVLFLSRLIFLDAIVMVIGYLLNMFIDGPHICSGSIETSTISRSFKVQLILLNSNHNFLFVVFLYDLGPEKLPTNLLISESHS